VLAVITVSYGIWNVVISINDCIIYHFSNGVKLIDPMSKPYPFTEKAIIMQWDIVQCSAL
jgi:hypothetical protein